MTLQHMQSLKKHVSPCPYFLANDKLCMREIIFAPN